MPAHHLDEELRTRGYRVTRPRRAVWEVLRTAEGHLTVDDIAERLDAQGAGVDPASVYRTLGLFEQLGLARPSRLGAGDAAHWEIAHPDEHFHVVCEVCGDVDHHVGSLVAEVERHLTSGHGFEVREIELVVHGRCARCRGGGD